MTKMLQSSLWDAATESPDRPLTEAEIEERIQSLLKQMTLDEKIGQMAGDALVWRDALSMLIAYNYRPFDSGKNKRLGIPPIRFTDGPRGIVLNHSTCFPATMARGASWDVDLETRIGDAIGVEARAQDANFFGGVCINLLRHPAWGRAQETYGEDPYHLGEMGVAMQRGAERHVMVCVKHFALNNIERNRYKVDIRVDERTMHEVYLPHFKRCVDEGAAAILSAYNKVNGEYCGHNAHLLRDILKGGWGFTGLVMSDYYFGVRDTVAGALGGLDIEMPFAWYFGWKLKRAVKKGAVPEAVIDEAVTRILRQKLRFAHVGEPERYKPEAVLCDDHIALAREAAQKSMVLLKNDAHLLPLDVAKIKHIAVIGQLANKGNVGDKGSGRVRTPYVITPLAGIRAAVPGDVTITYHNGRNIRKAAEVAAAADVVVLVAGYTHLDEGEYLFLNFVYGSDRDSLTLKPHDEALIQAVAAKNPKTVVVLHSGGPVIMEAWRDRVGAILMAWYAGMEGGHALADILFGKVNPSAKLPCVFPKSPDGLPFFDNKADTITYDYYHGYRLMDKNGYEAAFPFGFGLSYTSYAYGDLHLSRDEIAANDTLIASIDVTNTGPRAGEEIVQLYVGYVNSQVDRPVKDLKGFKKIRLEPGQTQTVKFVIDADRLAYYDADAHRWRIESIEYIAYAGPSSASLSEARFRIV